LDTLLTIQGDEPEVLEKPKPEVKTEEITWNPYNCASCTFINDQNPVSLCQVCGAPAPESAKVVTKITPDPALAAEVER